MSADGQAGVVKVKAILSNIITVLLCSLAVITVVVAVIAGLHWVLAQFLATLLSRR